MIGTPEQRIGAIIRGEKLLDEAEIDASYSDGMRFDRTNLEMAHRRELLEKILGWIES